MNIIEIYKKYHLPENLQMHMLRVAACSNLIIDNLNGIVIDKKAIIRASLLHDMGNMAKISDNEIDDEEFKKIRKEYIDKYDRNSHKINLIIAKEEGLNDYEIEIIDKKSSKRGEETLNSERYDVKILLYADQRVAPYGVTSLKERLEEVKKRYKNILELAELIGILHDIGRFEELKITKELNSVKFDHAGHGSKMLFEKGMIRKFIEDSQYDNIIKKAIENHSRLEIEENLDERTLLHSKIIRDADKIDNYRVKKDEKIEAIFPKRVNKIEDMEESKLSDKVYDTILDRKCVDIHDRVTPLDFWVCILAFTFDLNFDVSYKMVKENDYINVLIDRFEYKDMETKNRMEKTRKNINEFIDKKIDWSL